MAVTAGRTAGHRHRDRPAYHSLEDGTLDMDARRNWRGPAATRWTERPLYFAPRRCSRYLVHAARLGTPVPRSPRRSPRRRRPVLTGLV